MFDQLYLTTKAAPFTPTNFRGSWNDTAGQVTRALDVIKSDGGIITNVTVSETSVSPTYSALLYRGVSGPLAAQTISGDIDVVLGVNENTAAADMVFHLHVYVTVGDTDTVRGTLLSDYIDATEFPTTAVGRALTAPQALSSLAISDGDRLVVEIGYRALNSVNTLFAAALRYGTRISTEREAPDLSAGSANVTVEAGFLGFSSAIAELPVETRLTQFAPEFPSVGEQRIRMSQFAPEFPSVGEQRIRMSQFAPEFPSQGEREIRMTQFVAEFVTPNRRRNPIVFVVT